MNPCYQVNAASAMNPHEEEDLTMIPKIKRSQIVLTQFIGSGAFGEVYEGKDLRNLNKIW